MNLSAVLRQALYLPETDKVLVVLVTLDHPALAVPIRLALDRQDLPSRGNIFLARHMEVRLPAQSADTPGRGSLAIGNVSTEILDALRTLPRGTTPVSVLIEIVRKEDPDTVEAAWDDLELLEIGFDALLIEGQIGQENFLRQPYPQHRYTPAIAPGLFR